MSWAVPIATTAASMAYDYFSKDKLNKKSGMSKQQKSLMKQMTKMLGRNGQLGRGNKEAMAYQRQLMDPSSESVRQFSQPYVDQFNQQTVPGLAERFAGMGGGMGGGLSSSGFGQSLGAAGANLQTQLAQLKAGLGQNAAQSLMQQYGNNTQTALNAKPFMYQQQGPSVTGGLLQGWAQSGFSGASNMFGGASGNGGMGGGGGATTTAAPTGGGYSGGGAITG